MYDGGDFFGKAIVAENMYTIYKNYITKAHNCIKG
jgi:hypothetical protein